MKFKYIASICIILIHMIGIVLMLKWEQPSVDKTCPGESSKASTCRSDSECSANRFCTFVMFPTYDVSKGWISKAANTFDLICCKLEVSHCPETGMYGFARRPVNYLIEEVYGATLTHDFVQRSTWDPPNTPANIKDVFYSNNFYVWTKLLERNDTNDEVWYRCRYTEGSRYQHEDETGNVWQDGVMGDMICPIPHSFQMKKVVKWSVATDFFGPQCLLNEEIHLPRKCTIAKDCELDEFCGHAYNAAYDQKSKEGGKRFAFNGLDRSNNGKAMMFCFKSPMTYPYRIPRDAVGLPPCSSDADCPPDPTSGYQFRQCRPLLNMGDYRDPNTGKKYKRKFVGFCADIIATMPSTPTPPFNATPALQYDDQPHDVRYYEDYENDYIHKEDDETERNNNRSYRLIKRNFERMEDERIAALIAEDEAKLDALEAGSSHYDVMMVVLGVVALCCAVLGF